MGDDKYHLHRLVYANKVDELEAALTRDDTLSANLNTLCRGQSPLTLAISLGRSECVRLLLSAGASTLVKNAEGWTAFQEATSYGNREVMELVYRKRRKELALWLRTTGTKVLQGLSKDLNDFYLEMRWQFGSYVPFVSTLCPSDTYKGHSIRIDTTLVGFERLSWVRGDISLIFTEEKDGSRLVICDHQRRLVQQLWPRDFTIGDEQIQEEISVSLNTKMVTPPDFDFSSFSASRTQSGFWTFKVDRTERVGPWDTSVWSIDSLQCTTKMRTEHLKANPPPPVTENDVKKDSESESDVEEVDEEEMIRRYDAGEWNKEKRDKGKKAFRELARFRPTLDAPEPTTVTAEEFFLDTLAGEYLHVGRPIIEEKESHTYSATLWMYDEDAPVSSSVPPRESEEIIIEKDSAAAAAYTYFPTIVQATPTPPPSIRSDKFPLKFETVLPLLELIGMGGSEHVVPLKEFLNSQLPPGFPGAFDSC
ncbi:hypothetical protein PhCBS80983_g00309 [Powellomyces hirtus]|uniref:Ankyrin repeat domain-containing protein n=1 Tax=Powellomyces hirtus TaxID=109895 RepID=A0A507EHA4_9FUNG|nr:hypothetical protein PhCBS80983_g00309 [Powellomyces hirtus]